MDCNDKRQAHQFEPRYNIIKGPSNLDEVLLINMAPEPLIKLAEKHREVKEEYIHDICVKCGKVIKYKE